MSQAKNNHKHKTGYCCFCKNNFRMYHFLQKGRKNPRTINLSMFKILNPNDEFNPNAKNYICSKGYTNLNRRLKLEKEKDLTSVLKTNVSIRLF
jgi:hypothetical protein